MIGMIGSRVEWILEPSTTSQTSLQLRASVFVSVEFQENGKKLLFSLDFFEFNNLPPTLFALLEFFLLEVQPISINILTVFHSLLYYNFWCFHLMKAMLYDETAASSALKFTNLIHNTAFFFCFVIQMHLQWSFNFYSSMPRWAKLRFLFEEKNVDKRKLKANKKLLHKKMF